MPYRKVEICAGNYYHLYNRGVNHQKIFFNSGNWTFFIQRLRDYFLPEYVDLLVYCLMPNHYHLMIYVKHDDFAELVMQPFSVSYVKAINKQQARSGPLFEGPFKAIHVERDEYLCHLSRYIHMNPVVAKLASTPEQWRFSSYQDYIGLRNGTLPNKNMLRSLFSSTDAHRSYVQSYNLAEDRLFAELLFDA